MADDTEAIVRAAQRGDQDAVAALYRRHYAGMVAVATWMLGVGPDAEDACQDAAITAAARIGDLRDPAAVGGWLHAIVRNNCRTMLSARKPIPVGVAGQDLSAPDDDDPVERIERSAQRDWVWHGVRQLTPAVQPVAMLRYFAENNSYEQIATLCRIPVGTVRSRLSEARRQLSAILPQVLDARHDDTSALTAARREEAIQILFTVANGRRFHQVTDRLADDLTMYWPEGYWPDIDRTTGLDRPYVALCNNYQDGVTYEVTSVAAGAGVTTWETRFIHPPDQAGQFPSSGTWLLREKRGRISDIRLLHSR